MAPTHKTLPLPERPGASRRNRLWVVLGAVLIFVLGLIVGHNWGGEPATIGLIGADQADPPIGGEAGLDAWIEADPVLGATPEAAAQARAVARDVCYSLEDGMGNLGSDLGFGWVEMILIAGAQPPPGWDSRMIEEYIRTFMGYAVGAYCPEYTAAYEAWIAS